jgi:iron complex outermembrane receptor protein
MGNGKKRKIFCILLLSLVCLASYAQNTVRGQVLDEKKEPVIGATIHLPGTNIGTVTDLNGNYVLTNLQSGAVIEISYIGYQAEKITYTGQEIIHTLLQEDIRLLDEVVVIGYGSVKKDDLTGSVTAIKADLNGRGLAANAQDLLVGKVAGVSVTTGGGAPTDGATIRIRGGSSLTAVNDPLIVVDGIPLGGGPGGVGNLLSAINPTDIETFTILKDASATAIYGSRASNGVIMITTKKGTKGKTKITYDGNVSFSQKRNQVDVLNGDEFRNLVKKIYSGATNEAEAVGKLGTATTDWQQEIFQTAVNTEHNLSVLGSVNDVLPYRASVGYTDVNGILKTAGMERYTGSLSLSPVLLDNHLTINLNARGMYIKNRFADRSAIGAATAMDPTQPVRDENSPFGGYWSWIGGDGNLIRIATKNPVAMLEMKDDRSESYQFIGNAQLDYSVHFLPDLHLNLNIGIDYSHSEGYTNIPVNSPMQNMEYTYNKDWRQDRKNPLLDLYANYKKDLTFLESNLDITGGYSWQHFWHKDPYIQSEIGHFDENGDPLVYRETNLSEYYLLSFFGRLNYSVLNKYLLTLTLRDDASSRFLKGHQWGLFPSAAFAWRIKEEPFLKNIDVLSNLKLRLGWGITGQQDLGKGDYPAVNSYQYSEGTAANYYMGDHWVEFIKPLAYNPILTWEKTATYNAGIDYGFFNNRISGAIDYYYRKTTDLFNAEVRVAAGTNFNEYVPANVGSLENSGLEFSINALPLVSKDWKWEAGFNLAYNKNKITQLTSGEEKNARLSPFESTGGDGGRPLKIHQVGYPAGMFYVYEQVYDASGKPVEGLYVDRNNDGKVNEEDLYIYRNAAPNLIFGFNTRLTWKAWDLSVASHGSLGNYNYNGMASNHAELSISQVYYGGYLSNRYRSAFDSDFQMKQVRSDYYIQDASFFRIDNITLGWSFRKISHLPLSGRIYGSLQNPVVFTGYTGLDPEILGGIDNDFYPRPVSALMGININF